MGNKDRREMEMKTRRAMISANYGAKGLYELPIYVHFTQNGSNVGERESNLSGLGGLLFLGQGYLMLDYGLGWIGLDSGWDDGIQ